MIALPWLNHWSLHKAAFAPLRGLLLGGLGPNQPFLANSLSFLPIRALPQVQLAARLAPRALRPTVARHQ